MEKTQLRYVGGESITNDFDYFIYTDGGYSQKHNIGAFAHVILSKDGIIVSKMAKKIVNETNNRAELKAILSGIYNLPNDAKKVCIISDSQYALKTCSKVWGRNTNIDLFEWLDMYLDGVSLDITFKWVRGHSGNKWNEMCDQMCNEAAGIDLNEEYRKYAKKITSKTTTL